MIVDEIAEEATHIMQVQHFHLRTGDILSFVITGGRLSKHYEAEIQARIREQIPVDVKVAIVYGGYLRVDKEAPE